MVKLLIEGGEALFKLFERQGAMAGALMKHNHINTLLLYLSIY